MPPAKNADVIGSRPPTWLSGMKFTFKTAPPVEGAKFAVHSLARVRSVIMAPFGAPVLPDVYMMIASRSSLPPV